jgi:hypothetical protein
MQWHDVLSSFDADLAPISIEQDWHSNPSVLMVSRGHSSQPVLPGANKLLGLWPIGQLEQLTFRISILYVPLGQSIHSLLSPLARRPGGHNSHVSPDMLTRLDSHCGQEVLS